MTLLSIVVPYAERRNETGQEGCRLKLRVGRKSLLLIFLLIASLGTVIKGVEGG